MAHGITLAMRWIKRPAPTYLHEHPVGQGLFGGPPPWVPYRNPSKDRSLAGKDRIRARRAHQKAAR